jgi:hypothetical protein
MQNINKNDSNKDAVLGKLAAVRAALQAEPASPLVTQALDQCDRLKLAISQFHAEGLRFAAFTLLRLTQAPGTAWGAAVQTAAQDFKTALDEAGYPH